MKAFVKITAIVALALSLSLFAVACSDNDTTTSPETDPPACDHAYSEEITREAMPLSDGVITFTCDMCGDSYEEAIPATKIVKILAIGNSFSVDAMEYLWDMCKAGGAEEIVLGNLYIGGCSLSTHYTNSLNEAKSYTYYKNEQGFWRTYPSKSIKDGITDEDWDIITVQQASGDSGVAKTYSQLPKILEYVNENKTNPDAKIWWHMTWAYQGNSTHNSFPKYNKDQMTMYDAIVSATKEKALSEELICDVIPSGTAIQNLRSSYIGDTVTRDGYHMSYDIGRYTTALTWFATLAGGDVDALDWVPKAHEHIRYDIAAIREAVKAALAEKYAVTESTMTERSLEDLFAALELDFSKYEEIDWKPQLHAYYNSTNNSTLYTTASNCHRFIVSKMFDRTTLPVGSVILLDSGYQYRPEGWTSLSATNTSSTRPTNVTGQVVIVTDTWWGSFNYRAFNLSNSDGASTMKAEESAHLRIYVPIAE